MRFHRRCKFPARCRTLVEQEEAFCFVKDSFCFKWIFEKVCSAHEEDDSEEDAEEYVEYYGEILFAKKRPVKFALRL
jgi:hypothetical protein